MLNLFRLARGSYGIWSQLRRFNNLLEWNLTTGLTLHTPWGTFTLEGSVPPSRKHIKEAEKEKYETIPVDEEKLAGEQAVRILKKRAKGESLEEDEPGDDWELF